MRHFTLGCRAQIVLAGILVAVLSCGLLAPLAVVNNLRDRTAMRDEMARKGSEVEELKASYLAAFRQIDEFQTLFSNATCEISDIQDNLVRLAEHGLQQGKRGTPPPPPPRLEADANGCRSAYEMRPLRSANRGSEQEDAMRQRLDRLESALDRLRATHGAFLMHTANIESMRIDRLERMLKTVGLNPATLASVTPVPASPPQWYGQGGPFISTSVDPGTAAEIAPVSLFNTRASRLGGLTLALRTLPLAEPLEDYDVTSPFGARNDPINFMTGIHEGVDLGAPEGTPVTTTGDGIVVWAGPRDRYGKMVEIDHGMGLHTRYAHLSRVLVHVDQRVGRGSPIGLLGSTGRTTGPHLHYEVRMNGQAVNPMKFILAGRDVLKAQ